MTAPLRRWLLACALLLLGSVGVAAVWLLVGLRLGSLCSPLALLAALDVTLLLHLARVPRGAVRVAAASLATAFTVLLAGYGLIAAWIGQQMGMQLWDSAARLGLQPAWLILRLSLDALDWLWFAAAVALAALLAR